jgi:hypothetical protein
VNQGSTREEMWNKVLALRKEIKTKELLLDHATLKNKEMTKKLTVIRRLLNASEGELT